MSERISAEPTLWSRASELARKYRFRPHTSNFGIDLVYLVLLVALEESVVRSVFGSHIYIDLVSSWLACSVLRKDAGSAFLYVLFVASVQEARFSTPAGTYFCSYWILTTLIVHFRPVLSWRFYTPWMAMFLLSNSLVILIGFLVVLVSSSFVNIAWWGLPLIVTRLAVGLGFGLLICREFIGPYAEEPIPQ